VQSELSDCPVLTQSSGISRTEYIASAPEVRSGKLIYGDLD
jgi:hypothetical protein